MTSLPRLHLFEFNDAAWAPRSLRDTIVESLSHALDWRRALAGVVAPFESFVGEAGVREVLDVCAGAGGPASVLAREIRRAGRVPPRFILTDLHPRPRAWQAAARRAPLDLAHEPAPVDATRIPPRLAAGRARVILNAFHHFPPSLAQKILADAVASSSPIFIAEPFERNPLGLTALVFAAALALVATPLLTARDRLQKLLWTVTALAPLASLWDGVVSTLRVYDEAELRAMVAPLGDGFRWTWGRHRYGLGGRGYYFYGVPRELTTSS
jgi:hypothetical protein